jgi:hypothetical protein
MSQGSAAYTASLTARFSVGKMASQWKIAPAGSSNKKKEEALPATPRRHHRVRPAPRRWDRWKAERHARLVVLYEQFHRI